ncbi:DUF305 domain-containing protein [Actinoplanes sp. TBRC 11911]|uniref:DUF305 domain-containing protein n=1 Tax=Actinoplanes sp. TBRC 11911 TaxID=2729386 RepID=UPI00145DAD4A|nr:DUF305 domain-containing protein [Actinoplanes sp. TBRC 11911]NMO53158.1 DUF305 domain-containing protein [Actinoplanes sp. TBRC 11911]
MRPKFAALLIATALLPATAGCTHRAAAAPEVVPAASVAVSATFGGTDLAWIEINIAMNDQVLPLLALVPARSGEPALTKLSAEVQASATAGLTTLHSLHDRAGLPSANPHEGMLMPGLIPADEVTRLATLTGPGFDRAVGEQLRTYLEQSRRLAQDEQKAGTDPDTRALATRIATDCDAALRQLAAAA